MEVMDLTKPKRRFPEGYKVDPSTLAGKRYGTLEMAEIWGAEKTFDYILRVQGQAALTLSRLHPDIISPELAQEISEKANISHINPNRIRELEEKTGHDVIAVNTALEEVVNDRAKSEINKAKTSADSTQPARALQLKSSLEVIADSAENLRDILIEKSLGWKDKIHMDCTHGYDALPTFAGRPFAHYTEMLQTGLNFLKFVYDNSIVGKWSDATGNHHSAVSLGIDGMKLQEEYCRDLKIGFMDAAAQVPGLEFEADIFYSMNRLAETMNNVARYIKWGRTDDVNIFINKTPGKKKGSSAMPHKDAKNGNPDIEEQFQSIRRDLKGKLVTAMDNCEMDYARDLSGSANTRLNFEYGFKFFDHGIRRLAEIAYYIELREERAKERVSRSFGVVTAQQVMNYLTDGRKVANPMPRSKAHDILGRLAARSWECKENFFDVLRKESGIIEMMESRTLFFITDPLKYVGQSKEIIERVASKYYHKKTLI